MRKPRKPAAPAVPMTPEQREEARKALKQAYHGFLTGTAEEDPKRFTARIAAAREALDQLNQLRDPDDADEPSEEQLLAEARAAIADENKS
jgi:transposase